MVHTRHSFLKDSKEDFSNINGHDSSHGEERTEESDISNLKEKNQPAEQHDYDEEPAEKNSSHEKVLP